MLMDTSFSVTQQGKRVLVVNGYMYQKNKEYRPRNSDSPVIYWHCERKRDINCKACVHTDVGGSNINLVNDSHNHGVSTGRAEAMQVRHELLEAGAARCDAAPAQLINKMLTPTVALHLSSETLIKEAIRRRRRHQRPREPESSSDIVVDSLHLGGLFF